MKRLCQLLLSLSLCAAPLAIGCSSAASSSDDPAMADGSDEELRSPATAFFEREPLSGTRVEALRRELTKASTGYAWVQNQGTVFGVEWQAPAAALDDGARASVVQAAFTFHLRNADASMKNRKYVSDLKAIAATDEALGAALDFVGLQPDDGDAATTAERAKLADALGAAARTKSLTVYTGSLHYQVDMYWENVLVVVDEENRQILFATGGYGT